MEEFSQLCHPATVNENLCPGLLSADGHDDAPMDGDAKWYINIRRWYWRVLVRHLRGNVGNVGDVVARVPSGATGEMAESRAIMPQLSWGYFSVSRCCCASLVPVHYLRYISSAGFRYHPRPSYMPPLLIWIERSQFFWVNAGNENSLQQVWNITLLVLLIDSVY